MTSQFVLLSCFFYIFLRHTNIMTDKEFNPYDEYAARCVHQFPQEKEYTFSSSGDSKMYTSGSVANTQRC